MADPKSGNPMEWFQKTGSYVMGMIGFALDIAAVIGIVVWATRVNPSPPLWVIIIGSLGILGVVISNFFISWGFMKERNVIIRERERERNAEPHIKFKGFSIVRASIEANGSTLTSGQPIVDVFPKFKDGDYFAGTREKNPGEIHTLLPRFYRILFANDPDKRQSANEALDVRAEIKFYDATSKQPIFTEIEGRWSDTERPGTEGFKPISSNRVAMPPNGQPFLLDIVMKYDEDNECYAHNNESPHRTAGDFRDKERGLVAGEYDVEVWIRGSNVDESFWFHLVNQGKDKQAVLTPMPDSQ